MESTEGDKPREIDLPNQKAVLPHLDVLFDPETNRKRDQPKFQSKCDKWNRMNKLIAKDKYKEFIDPEPTKQESNKISGEKAKEITPVINAAESMLLKNARIEKKIRERKRTKLSRKDFIVAKFRRDFHERQKNTSKYISTLQFT